MAVARVVKVRRPDRPERPDETLAEPVTETAGDCADCHAPAIDGEVGGRDLLEAGGLEGKNSAEGDRAYEYGVHCDLCHKVDQIHLDAKPGVGGRLGLR